MFGSTRHTYHHSFYNRLNMLADSERLVTVYHGTSVEHATEVVQGKAFLLSENDYDWLGHGVYFWECAPFRAWDWATAKYGADAAVIEAEIRLGHCLDLTD